MIYMIIHLTLFPGKKSSYIDEFKKIAPSVRKEEGCLQYEIYVDSPDSRFDNEKRDDLIIISEKWDSIESLQKHSSSPFMSEFKNKTKDFRKSSKYELLTPA